MSCTVEYDLLNDFAEDRLDELSALILEEHIKTCKECWETVAEINALNYLLSEIKREEILFPHELKEIKNTVLSKLKSEKSVLLNIRIATSRIISGREKVNDYINSYPGVKRSRKIITFAADGLLKGISFLSSKAAKRGYKTLLEKAHI
jgi:anti-sigma factor RsiW